MRRHYGMYIPRGEIRGQFQPEQPALSPSPTLHVEVFETVYRGRQHYDRNVASENIPYYSDQIGEEMTPEEEAEIERRLLRGHVPGYDFPEKKDEGDDQSDDEESNDDGYDDSDEDDLDDDSDEDEDESDDQ